MKGNDFSQSMQHRLWRSMLFVPAHMDKFVDKAHTRSADAVILDLEDSIPLAEKENARARVATAAKKVSKNGADVLVRINSSWRMAIQDLEAVVVNSVTAVVIPKVSSAEHLQFVSEVIDELESERGMVLGHTKLVALIESPGALAKLESIAQATPRLLAMTLGTEDFSMATGMQPTAESLLFPSQQLLFAARSANLMPLGFIGSIADYSDIESFKETIVRSRNLGFVGGFCIHPAQVLVMNEAFSPSAEEINTARDLLAAYQQTLSKGLGVFEFKGKMVDLPVVARAKQLIRSAKLIAGK